MNRCAALIVCLVMISCGGSEGDSNPLGHGSEAIINGQPCGSTDAPTAVAVIAVLGVQNAQGVAGTATVLLCTGTLIAPDTVLSAAHCVNQALIAQDLGVTVTGMQFYVSQTANLTALAGGSNTLPSDAVAVSSFVGNPGFNTTGTGLQNYEDVSLLFLSAANGSIVPEILISAAETIQVVDQAPVIIAGWGQQTNTPTPPAGTEGQEECAYSVINQVGATEMQVGAGPGTAYTCHGDSGGPAYMMIATTTPIRRRLVGITSHAYDTNYCDVGAVDTRVDAYLSWIDATMTQACSSNARVWCDVPGIIPATYYQSSGSGGSVTSGSSTENGQSGGTAGNYVDPKKGCGSTGGDVFSLLGVTLTLIRRRLRYRRDAR